MEVVKYKDSGVAWIGHIPEHWRITVLKRTTYIKGRVGWQGLTSEEYEQEGRYLLVTGTDFENGKVRWEGCWYVDEERYAEDPYIQLTNNDVLITKDGTIGKIALVENMPTEATLNSGVFVTRPYKNEYSPQFMFWLLNSDLFPEFIEYSKVGTTIAHLYQKTFERFSYPLPPLDEQRRIAAYLDKTCAAIDTAIEKKQRQIETLDALRKSIIHKAVTRGLDDSVELRDSGVEWIGKIPRHWKVKRIKRYAQVKRGASPRPIADSIYFDDDGEYAWVRIADVSASGRYLEKTTQILSELGATLSVKQYPGDLFISIAGTVGKPIITKIKCCIHDGFIWFDNPTFNKDYIYFIFMSEAPYQGLGKLGTQLNLNTDTIGQIFIPEPTKNEINVIISFLNKKTTEIDALKDNINAQIATLQQYRKSLIHECVTGKRRITEERSAGHTSNLVLT